MAIHYRLAQWKKSLPLRKIKKSSNAAEAQWIANNYKRILIPLLDVGGDVDG